MCFEKACLFHCQYHYHYHNLSLFVCLFVFTHTTTVTAVSTVSGLCLFNCNAPPTHTLTHPHPHTHLQTLDGTILFGQKASSLCCETVCFICWPVYYHSTEYVQLHITSSAAAVVVWVSVLFDISRVPDSTEGWGLCSQWLAQTTEFEEQIQDFCM